MSFRPSPDARNPGTLLQEDVARLRGPRDLVSVDNGRPIDYYFYEPDPDLELNPPGKDAREMEIRDGWPMADRFSVHREGFEIGRFGGGFTEPMDTQ